jgi:type IV pilus assembly protein PilM
LSLWDPIIHLGRSPIAVDLGATSIKMLQLQASATNPAVAAGGQFVLPLDLPEGSAERREAVVDGLQRLLAASPYRGRKVVSCLPDRVVQYKNIRMPSMPPGERAQAVRWEAGDRFQLGEHDRVEHLEAGSVRVGEQTRDELILMAATDAHLREHVEVLTAAGLTPIAIESTPVALARCFGRFVRRDGDQQQVRVILDVGGASSKVLILRGRSVAFFKTIDVGGRHLDQAVADHLELPTDEAAELRQKVVASGSPSEQADTPLFGSSRRENVHRAVFESVRPVINELANEVGLCLRYYSVTFRGSRPGRIELVGGEAPQAQLAEALAEQLQLEVTSAQPLENVDLSGEQITVERRATQGLWATALGLALRPASAGMRKRGAA